MLHHRNVCDVLYIQFLVSVCLSVCNKRRLPSCSSYDRPTNIHNTEASSVLLCVAQVRGLDECQSRCVVTLLLPHVMSAVASSAYYWLQEVKKYGLWTAF
jgi:uncharacterized protein YceK